MKNFTSVSKNTLLDSLKKAHEFVNITSAAYSTKNTSKFDINKKFKEKLDPVIEEFKSHQALDHPLFSYLEEQSKSGFNSRQFQIYRDNFFYRTELTIPSVAKTIEKAALEGDLVTVAETISNLYDEGGYGDPNKVHSKLLLDSHNLHGEKIFGLIPIDKLKNVKNSSLLLPESLKYRKHKIAVFNQPYPYIAGNTFAHELAADGMLVNFRKAFFDPYQNYYQPEEFKELLSYFTAHKDDRVEGVGVEEMHGIMARSAAERACEENIGKIPKMRKGGLDFLNTQSNLWFGMLREMEKAKDKGIIIPVKLEIDSKNNRDKPNTSLVPSKAQSLKIEENKSFKLHH
jgi:hypothetical protein